MLPLFKVPFAFNNDAVAGSIPPLNVIDSPIFIPINNSEPTYSINLGQNTFYAQGNNSEPIYSINLGQDTSYTNIVYVNNF